MADDVIFIPKKLNTELSDFSKKEEVTTGKKISY